MQRIESQGSSYGHAILQWLLFSQRPLYLPEVVEAVNVSYCVRPLAEDDAEKQRRLVVDSCEGFVAVTTADTGNLVLLSYITVRIFLLNIICDANKPQFPIRDGHETLLRTCLKTVIQHAPQVSKQNPRLNHLLLYASEIWPYHLDSFRSSDPKEPLPTDISNLVSRLIDPKSLEAFLGWLSLYDPAKLNEATHLDKALEVFNIMRF